MHKLLIATLSFAGTLHAAQTHTSEPKCLTVAKMVFTEGPDFFNPNMDPKIQLRRQLSLSRRLTESDEITVLHSEVEKFCAQCEKPCSKASMCGCMCATTALLMPNEFPTWLGASGLLASLLCLPTPRALRLLSLEVRPKSN